MTSSDFWASATPAQAFIYGATFAWGLITPINLFIILWFATRNRPAERPVMALRDLTPRGWAVLILFASLFLMAGLTFPV